MKTTMTLLLVLLTIAYAIGIPIVILSVFHLLFGDFYAKGFLTGLGHMLICGIMILVNVIVAPFIIFIDYKKYSMTLIAAKPALPAVRG